jgi:hypothetical protein
MEFLSVAGKHAFASSAIHLPTSRMGLGDGGLVSVTEKSKDVTEKKPAMRQAITHQEALEDGQDVFFFFLPLSHRGWLALFLTLPARPLTSLGPC